jgi:hypothetical protein
MSVVIVLITSFPDVIHTVGPQGEKPEKLESCYRTCLQVLTANKLRSVVRCHLRMRPDSIDVHMYGKGHAQWREDMEARRRKNSSGSGLEIFVLG